MKQFPVYLPLTPCFYLFQYLIISFLKPHFSLPPTPFIFYPSFPSLSSCTHNPPFYLSFPLSLCPLFYPFLPPLFNIFSLSFHLHLSPLPLSPLSFPLPPPSLSYSLSCGVSHSVPLLPAAHASSKGSQRSSTNLHYIPSTKPTTELHHIYTYLRQRLERIVSCSPTYSPRNHSSRYKRVGLSRSHSMPHLVSYLEMR